MIKKKKKELKKMKSLAKNMFSLVDSGASSNMTTYKDSLSYLE